MKFYNNKNAIRICLLLIFLFGGNEMELIAQTTLIGKVTDAESGEELIGANIVVKEKRNFIQGETTDIDGNFSIRVDPGTYDVEVSYTGYPTQRVEGVIAKIGVATKVDVQMKLGDGQLLGWIPFCGGCTIPMINQDEMTSKQKINSEQIKKLPTRNINDIIKTTPGVSTSQ